MLGSVSEADDAVQDAWLRMNRADISDVRNLRGWLTTVVARICLDMLRARNVRAEEPLDDVVDTPAAHVAPAGATTGPVDPEAEAGLADSVGVALLVILQTLSPAERLAFVLHDMFGLPFAEIGPIMGRSENAAAQLAARARRRVRGKTVEATTDFVRQRHLVNAFLAAARHGDFDALLAVLDDDVVLHVDATAAGTPITIRGARAVAANARMFSANSRFAETAVVDGVPGIVVAPAGRLTLVLLFRIAGHRIVELNIAADTQRLRQVELTVLR
ncbi:sigma-70 family RNA polymerase sigma factor [Mycolicibacterium sp. ND9-15]|uniref:sigma-70 family RNA polymerase sigma factor n=1 Tax=Mycolicibacterium sp. ND9-15 TaxID=3042320 RepID=UPI002DD8E577|nr:sigma-70 family RNA polymerase sigma factor [Mycolicibacterium sp. ND9-15]WSE58881.1 sigma-70 family RNA polymerase sigma factor [Mycolicibacterium sp. ND9-15]